MTRAQALRIVGAVPAGYYGPVYYRLAEDMFASAERNDLRWNEPAARLDRAFDFTNRLTGYRSLLDGSGQLLDEWKDGLRAALTGTKPRRREFDVRGVYVLVSDRVFLAITELEPIGHPAIPVAVARDDGSIERWHALLTYAAHIGDPLCPEANRLEPIVYTDGSNGYSNPSWLMDRSGKAGHFGYLNRAAITDRHLFHGSNGVHYLSPDLFARLQPFGDIFPRSNILIPIGVAGEG